MRIDLTALLQKIGEEAEVEKTEKVSFPEDSLNLSQPVRVKLHLVNAGDSVLVAGDIETEAELECSRCLKTFKLPVSARIKEEFSSSAPAYSGGGETELKAEDFVYPIEKDNTIDLSEVIRQNLLLAVPIKPLCRIDCRGIKGE